VVLTAAWVWGESYVPPWAMVGVRMLFCLVAGVIPLVLFLRQTAENLKLAGVRADLSNW
jgi:hypothetical protein